MTIDAITQAWIRNESDRKAAAEGYRFDLERACFTVWWIERFCKLYEGEWAGEPLILRGLHDDEIPEARKEWDEVAKDEAYQRAWEYNEGFKAGEPCDWQYECTMRVHGWVRYSDRWKRDVRRFRTAYTLVAKKNKKSPTEAAWALFHTCGDSEHGNKCYFAAADGKQAGIAAKHATEMVWASPELSETCRINKTTKTITHVPTKSMAEPISSSNERAQKAKEGLNGSVFIDEAHVVDRRLVRRIDRAGISRSEPLIAIFSTAGDDPDSWGHEQVEYGRDVIAGKIDDPTYFFAEYAAPQDVSDADLDADPVRYGKLANPAWNHTIGEEEFLSDYRRSCRNVTELAAFKMYRLNIWQKTSHPWKIAPLWSQCIRDRPITDFYGKPCWLGGDLSRSRDMSAIVATFREDMDEISEYYQFCWVWMVREYAEKHASKAPFLQWETDGFLEFCESTIDQRQIEAVIGELAENHYVREFRHDPSFANELARNLEETKGILGVPFAQTILRYAKPVDDFEALVKEEHLHTNGHPVYAWEIGHAKIKADPNNNRRVIKPTDDDYRKVDIVQAGIMSLSGAVADLGEKSIYASRGMLYASGV